MATARTLLAPTTLDTGELTALLRAPEAGGICVFIGTTRADVLIGRRIVALEYEAYEDMAREQLDRLVERAAGRFAMTAIVLAHRTGRVAVGEASVFVGVASPHRADAFEACRWLIDTLKAELAVWKRDVFEDGEASWTKPNSEAFDGLEGV